MNINFNIPSSDDRDWVGLVTALGPHVLWALLVVALFFFIGPRKIAAAVLSARKMSFAGFEIELRSDLSEAAAEKNVDLSAGSQDQVSNRILRSSSLFSGSRLLWIDDNPNGNVNEIRLLRRLGVFVDLALNDAEARRGVCGAVYDIVLSDMARGQDRDAGRKLIPDIRNAVLAPALIFYVGHDEPTPKGVFGLTTRPDELFNLIMDALERRKA